jgi:hypothetical protein
VTTKSTKQTQTDIEALVPEPEVFTLTSGSVVRIKPLRTLELLKLLKVLTRGIGPNLDLVNFDEDSDSAAFAQQLILVITSAIPEAPEEMFDFIRSMVRPETDWIERPLTKEQRASNAQLQEDLDFELQNPEIEDTIDIVSKIIENEAEDLQGLGKKVVAVYKTTAGRLGAKNSSSKTS